MFYPKSGSRKLTSHGVADLIVSYSCVHQPDLYLCLDQHCYLSCIESLVRFELTSCGLELRCSSS